MQYLSQPVWLICIYFQVTVNERLNRFRSNHVLGEVVIALDTFLYCPRQHKTSWYKLFSGCVAQLNSTDSFWNQSVVETLPPIETSVPPDHA